MKENKSVVNLVFPIVLVAFLVSFLSYHLFRAIDDDKYFSRSYTDLFYLPSNNKYNDHRESRTEEEYVRGEIDIYADLMIRKSIKELRLRVFTVTGLSVLLYGIIMLNKRKGTKNIEIKPQEERVVDSKNLQTDTAFSDYCQDMIKEKTSEISENPENAKIYLDRGDIFLTLGNIDLALQDFRKAHELYVLNGKNEEAQAVAIKISEHTPKA